MTGFQNHHGLVVDGVIGPRTFSYVCWSVQGWV
jgi:murein L,D-transpeptidase YcbB/YkuD